MKRSNLEQNLFTRKPAAPVYLKGGDKAVLLIHGYNGYAKDFEYLASRLNKAGFSVAVPRLAGHGTSAADFLSTNAEMWLRSAIDAYLDLKLKHETVYVAGLSMGGLLTLILASMFDIKKIALMAPALINRKKDILFTPFFRHFITKKKRNWQGKENDEDDIYLADEYWKWNFIPSAAEFLKLQKHAKKILKFVKSDVFTIVSTADEMIAPESAGLIEKNASSINCEKLMLTESPHVMSKGPDKELIADRIIDWFSR